jgi:hypothetical protein
MNNNIFTQEDYDKFFNGDGEGNILKHWYDNYFEKAVEIAPSGNGNSTSDWWTSARYNSYKDFVKEWETKPCHFYIDFEPAVSFNEYIDEYALLEDIIDRMAKLMQKDYPDLYIVATEDRLAIFLGQGEKNEFQI